MDEWMKTENKRNGMAPKLAMIVCKTAKETRDVEAALESGGWK